MWGGSKALHNGHWGSNLLLLQFVQIVENVYEGGTIVFKQNWPGSSERM